MLGDRQGAFRLVTAALDFRGLDIELGQRTGEDRFLRLLWPQCSLIIDMDDTREKGYGTYVYRQSLGAGETANGLLPQMDHAQTVEDCELDDKEEQHHERHLGARVVHLILPMFMGYCSSAAR